MLTFTDVINEDLKLAFNAAENKNFVTAFNLLGSALGNVEQLPENEKSDMLLKVSRMIDTVKDLQANKDDWFASYYACSAGASAINDVKANRHRTVKIG